MPSALLACLRALVQEDGWPLERALPLFTSRPAARLRLPRKGRACPKLACVLSHGDFVCRRGSCHVQHAFMLVSSPMSMMQAGWAGDYIFGAGAERAPPLFKARRAGYLRLLRQERAPLKPAHMCNTQYEVLPAMERGQQLQCSLPKPLRSHDPASGFWGT